MSAIRRYNGQNWLPSLFNDFFDNDWLVKANATAPAINVIESDTDYKVEIAAPGMKKEDFTIHVGEDNELTIAMEKKDEKKEEDKKNKRYLRQEFSYTQFEQTLILPEDVDKDKIAELIGDEDDEIQINVKIGSSGDADVPDDCSVVTATYSAGGKNLGTYGVIGPIRMDYTKVITVLENVGKALEGIVGSRGKDKKDDRKDDKNE